MSRPSTLCNFTILMLLLSNYLTLHTVNADVLQQQKQQQHSKSKSTSTASTTLSSSSPSSIATSTTLSTFNAQKNIATKMFNAQLLTPAVATTTPITTTTTTLTTTAHLSTTTTTATTTPTTVNFKNQLLPILNFFQLDFADFSKESDYDVAISSSNITQETTNTTTINNNNNNNSSKANEVLLNDNNSSISSSSNISPITSNYYTTVATNAVAGTTATATDTAAAAAAAAATYDIKDDYNCYNRQHALGNLITMTLYASVCIVGLLGNTLVIYVVLRYSKMQTVTNIYILNLAFADECYLIGIPFLLHTMHYDSWKFGDYMCKAYMVSTSVTQFTSSIFLLIMSADRYVAVCHPISATRFRTPLVSKFVSALAWLMSVLLMLPVILFANTVQHGDDYSCVIKWPETEHLSSGKTFILYTFVLGFAAPLTFILIFYCLVIRKLHTVGPEHKSKEKKRSHRKVTKLVLTVITVYIMCWLPYWISQVMLIHSPLHKCHTRFEIMIFLMVGCLAYSNSAMNPLLYAFLSDNFKKGFIKAFACATRKNVNTQMQQECNSTMPNHRAGGSKNRKTERFISSAKAKQQKALLASSTNSITNFPGTSTVHGTGITAMTSIADAISDISSSDIMMQHERNVIEINLNLLPISSEPTESSSILHMNSVNADVANNDVQRQRPPVLHTDL